MAEMVQPVEPSGYGLRDSVWCFFHPGNPLQHKNGTQWPGQPLYNTSYTKEAPVKLCVLERSYHNTDIA